MPRQDERGRLEPPQARPLRPGHDELPRPGQVRLGHLPQHGLVPGLHEAGPEHLHQAAGQDPGQDPQEPEDLCLYRLGSGVNTSPGSLSGQMSYYVLFITEEFSN